MTSEGFTFRIDRPLTATEKLLYQSSNVVFIVLDTDSGTGEDSRRLLTSLHVDCVLPSLLMIAVAPGWVFGEAFECFAIEIIASIPLDETPADIFYVRNRIHGFASRVSKDALPSLPSQRPAGPFIEAKWHGVQLDHISTSGCMVVKVTGAENQVELRPG